MWGDDLNFTSELWLRWTLPPFSREALFLPFHNQAWQRQTGVIRWASESARSRPRPCLRRCPAPRVSGSWTSQCSYLHPAAQDRYSGRKNLERAATLFQYMLHKVLLKLPFEVARPKPSKNPNPCFNLSSNSFCQPWSLDAGHTSHCVLWTRET